MKKTDFLGWLILVTMLIISTIFYIKLDNISKDVKNYEMPKLMITDNVQFEKLCKQFTQQWGGKDYAVYILQPNSKFKTHKELASSSIKNLPIRLGIEDFKGVEYKNDGYYLGDINTFSQNITTQEEIKENYVIIPIYKHNIMVAEFYITYDSIPNNIETRVLEAQTLTQVIQ